MPRATTIFDADDSRLSQAWKKLARDIEGAKKRFAVLGGAVLAGFAGAAAGGAVLAAGIKGAFDEGGKLLDLSNQTGIAIDKLAILGQEAKNAGTDLESVAGAVNKMQKNLAAGAADDVLSQMGLDPASLKAADPTAAFQQIGKAIAALPSATDRTAAAMAVFGKSGAGLLSMFMSGGFGDAATQVGSQAEILARDAALFDDVGDKLALVGTKVAGFFVGVADKVAPVLKPLLDSFANFDGAKLGQDVGDAIATVAQMFTDGTLWDSLALTISIALGKAINMFVGGLLGAAAFFGSAMVEVMMLAGRVLKDAMDPRNLLAAIQGKGPLSMEALNAKLFESIGRTNQAVSQASTAGQVIDVGSMETMLQENISKAFDGATKAQETALAATPTVMAGVDAASLDLGGGGKANVSALQRVAGGGGGGGDPMLLEQRRQSGLLQRIAAAVEQRTPTSYRPAGTEQVYA